MNKMIKDNLRVLSISFLTIISYLALFAIGFTQQFNTINTNVQGLGTVINSLIAVVVALAFLFFFYNLAIFIMASDKDKKEKSLSNIGYSIIGIFVIVSIWGIVAFIGGALGVEDGSAVPGDIQLPGVTQ